LWFRAKIQEVLREEQLKNKNIDFPRQHSASMIVLVALSFSSLLVLVTAQTPKVTPQPTPQPTPTPLFPDQANALLEIARAANCSDCPLSMSSGCPYWANCANGSVVGLELDSLFGRFGRRGDGGFLSSYIGVLSKISNLFLGFGGPGGCFDDRCRAVVIPSEFGLLTELTELTDFDGLFGGQLPPLGGLLKLTSLYFGGFERTAGLNGTLPAALPPKLRYVELRGRNLTGTLPTLWGLLSSLTHLSISNTQIDGSIPSEFNLLRGLQTLRLQSSRLTGTVPNLTNTNLSTLALTGNSLSGAPSLLPGSLTSCYLQQNSTTETNCFSCGRQPRICECFSRTCTIAPTPSPTRATFAPTPAPTPVPTPVPTAPTKTTPTTPTTAASAVTVSLSIATEESSGGTFDWSHLGGAIGGGLALTIIAIVVTSLICLQRQKNMQSGQAVSSVPLPQRSYATDQQGQYGQLALDAPNAYDSVPPAPSSAGSSGSHYTNAKVAFYGSSSVDSFGEYSSARIQQPADL
jgi:hypothetical protein